MAKKFAGFKPETLQNKILPALGYKGPTDQASINKFLASSPSAAAKMGKFTMVARQMVEGKPIKAAPGTSVEETEEGEINTTEGTTGDTGNVLKAGDITENILVDPKGAVSTPTVVSQTGEGTILDSKSDMFNISEDSPDLVATKATAAEDIVAPDSIATTQATAAQSQDKVQAAADSFEAATGQVSDQATYDATTIDPTQSAVLGLEVAQGEAAQVDAPDKQKVGEGELLEGSEVNQSRIEEELAKTKAGSVQDELADLMQDFEGGNTPAWAAGGMRKAAAEMAARGLSASSMAGMSIVQAAMEASLPIAKLDASNKTSMALEKARQRAEFLGQEFDQEFETKVKNAARIQEISNNNYSAAVDIALENSRLANSMNIANLDAKSAKTVADTAALASLERENLSAINLAAQDNAKAFLDMDMENLRNEQQTERTKFMEMANAIVSDTEQKNVIAKANMVEENQAEQFLVGLAERVAIANQSQQNYMEVENARGENLMKEFNAEDKRLREEFNANNARLIETTNATFKQQVTTEETAAINAAYELETKAANELSKAAYDAIISEAKDLMYYGYQGEQNHLDRVNKVTTANINSDSGGELEKGLAEVAKEVAINIIEDKFKSSTSNDVEDE